MIKQSVKWDIPPYSGAENELGKFVVLNANGVEIKVVEQHPFCSKPSLADAQWIANYWNNKPPAFAATGKEEV